MVQTRIEPGQVTGCLSNISKSTVVEEIAKSTIVQMLPYGKGLFVPSDADCTFGWLALGAGLEMVAKNTPSLEGTSLRWQAMNSNITSAFDALKRYAYRPFSANPDENTIDTKAYYMLHDFLWDARESGKDVIIVNTWFQSISEETLLKSGMIKIPTMVNEICLAVGANVIHGITSTILSGMVRSDILDDSDIAQLYHNTTHLIDYMIQRDYLQRPDLILLYYTSRIQFYLFLSRTLFLLESHKLESDFPHKLMDSVHQTYQTMLREKMTQTLLSEAKEEMFVSPNEGTNEEPENQRLSFFDDFLGNGDFSESGERLVTGEDRIFSTAAAANALMNTWTIFNSRTGALTWEVGAPEEVKNLIRGCIQWLLIHGRNDQNDSFVNVQSGTGNRDENGDNSSVPIHYKTWNAFFSNSQKGYNNFPLWYPANRFQYFNQTPIEGNMEELPKEPFFVGVSGLMNKEEYDNKLQELHFGRATPTSWSNYNDPGSNRFFFWSSDSYTYAMVLLAVSLFDNIDNVR